MDIRQITPAYAVSPQIDPADCAEIAAAGFKTIINNRPDAEVPPSHASMAMRAAAEAAGLTYLENPVTHQGLNMDMVGVQKQGQDDAAGPVLAYCASGTRSTIVWALSQAGQMDNDAIIAAAGAAGYDIGGMRPQLEMLS